MIYSVVIGFGDYVLSGSSVETVCTDIYIDRHKRILLQSLFAKTQTALFANELLAVCCGSQRRVHKPFHI